MPTTRKVYTTRQAAAALGIDDKTLQKWMQRRQLPKTMSDKDRRLRLVTREQLEDLSVFYEQPIDDSAVQNPAPRHTPSIASVLQNIADLSVEIESIKGARAAAPAPLPPPRPVTVPKEDRPPARDHISASEYPPMPLEWITVLEAGRRHRIPPTSLRRDRDNRRFPCEVGRWNRNGQIVDFALTPDEYEAFKAFYREHTASYVEWP